MTPLEKKLFRIQEKILQALRIEKGIRKKREYFIGKVHTAGKKLERVLKDFKEINGLILLKEERGIDNKEDIDKKKIVIGSIINYISQISYFLNQWEQYYKRENRIIVIGNNGLEKAEEILHDVDILIISSDNFLKRRVSTIGSIIPGANRKQTGQESATALLALMSSYLKSEIKLIKQNLVLIGGNLKEQHDLVYLIKGVSDGVQRGRIEYEELGTLTVKYSNNIYNLQQKEFSIIYGVREKSNIGKAITIANRINIKLKEERIITKTFLAGSSTAIASAPYFLGLNQLFYTMGLAVTWGVLVYTYYKVGQKVLDKGKYRKSRRSLS